LSSIGRRKREHGKRLGYTAVAECKGWVFARPDDSEKPVVFADLYWRGLLEALPMAPDPYAALARTATRQRQQAPAVADIRRIHCLGCGRMFEAKGGRHCEACSAANKRRAVRT
jgi:hypothetical protein